jgi:hypothetical protein
MNKKLVPMILLGVFQSIQGFAATSSPPAGTPAAVGSQMSGTQLACGYDANRQTTILGNHFKIVGNGIFMYDSSTEKTADAVMLGPTSRGVGVDVTKISDIAYAKYTKNGWKMCTLDAKKDDTNFLKQLMQTTTYDNDLSVCKPLTGQSLTYTPDPKNPNPSKDNKVIGNMTFSSDGTATASACDANDMDCPVKSGIADPQGMNFKMGSDGNLSATVNCPDANGGNTIAQSFIQTIGGSATPGTKTTINAGKTTPPTP